MKLVIDISEELYECAKNETYTSLDERDAIVAIRNGIPKEEIVYCDRNLCTQNEYNGISCDECIVNKE